MHPLIPQSHLTESGTFRPPPPFAEKALRCRLCRRYLVRTPSGWTCPSGLAAGCCPLIREMDMRSSIFEAARKWNARVRKKLRVGRPELEYRLLRDWAEWRAVCWQIPTEGDARPDPPRPPHVRPWCCRCREQDRVVLPTDSEPARKRFAEPYCERCQMPLRMAAHPNFRHRLPPPDF